MKKPLFLPYSLAVAVVALAQLATAHAAPTASSASPVGEVTLVIGEVKATAIDGSTRVVERGSLVREGDRLETGVGGHVHLRFVDGGRLSIRPGSRLQVENYSRTGDASAQTAIKFRLDEGVVRSITGTWGEAARERFRLNTPLAAIGIKGTDFVVKSDADNTLASVYTGAIVLAPLSGTCVTSFGPCQNGLEKLLSEDMKGQMISLSRQQTAPQMVPAVDLLVQRGRMAGAEIVAKNDFTTKLDAARPESAPLPEKTVVSESRAQTVLTAQAAVAAQATPTPSAPSPTTDSTPSVPPAAVPPTTAPVISPPVVTQLVWARLAAVAADGDTISRSFAQAKEAGFKGTVGNFAFSLYRDPGSLPTAVLNSADASANFRLAGGAAQLIWSDRGRDVVESARVDGGSLSVDFSRSSYATQLNVSNTRMGNEQIVSSGVVSASGILQSQAGNAFVSGALSLDGKEAGYFFDKTINAGQLSGITLWGR